MLGKAFAQFEPRAESWDQHVRRVSRETRDLVAATREVIARSREALALADESLKDRGRFGRRCA